MAESATGRIVSEVHDEPHIEGRRVTVRRIQALVEEADQSPIDVASDLQVELADVYAALHYYHTHPEEMQAAATRQQHRLKDAKAGDAKSIGEYEVDDDGAQDSR